MTVLRRYISQREATAMYADALNRGVVFTPTTRLDDKFDKTRFYGVDSLPVTEWYDERVLPDHILAEITHMGRYVG